MKKPITIPFSFVLDELYSVNLDIKPMFGCHALYLGNKMLLMLRSKDVHPRDNGVWVATTPEYLATLKSDFPSMRPVELLGENVTTWQNLPCEANDFEESVMRICTLIRKGDQRIGKIPKTKKRFDSQKPK